MKVLYICALFFWCNYFAQAQKSESISIGKKENYYSQVLKENRKIWIYTPDITSQLSSPDKRYPVLYLLDGEAHFFSTIGIIQQLSQANGNGVLPEMIVVAIENTNRVKDLSPLPDLNNTNPFIDFLSTELLPYIDKNYNTAPYKLLVGHSLGGLTSIDVLTKFPKLFNAYIAIDPSMWYNNEVHLKNTIAQFPNQNMNGNRLFVGTANTMPQNMTLSQLKTDTSIETLHIRSIFGLIDFLKTNTNGLAYSNKYYEKENHNSVPLLSEYDGLKFIFDFYQVNLTEKDFADSTALIASTLKTHYAEVTKKMGYKNAAPETFINYLAYDALGKNHFDKASALFNLNAEWYPESNNVFDSYADYYLVIKDTTNAITNYKKALQINNSESTLGKLNKISKSDKNGFTIEYLQRYAGVYTLIDFNLDMKLEMRNDRLWAIVPGIEDSEFLPISENIFTVKGQHGYTITFKMEDNKPIGFTSVQPNGTFEAISKKLK